MSQVSQSVYKMIVKLCIKKTEYFIIIKFYLIIIVKMNYLLLF